MEKERKIVEALKDRRQQAEDNGLDLSQLDTTVPFYSEFFPSPSITRFHQIFRAAHQTLLEDLSAQLFAEKQRRQEAEHFAEAIRKECRAPFVVPALLDAFMVVSELSDEVVTRIRQAGGHGQGEPG